METSIKSELESHGAHFVYYVDISGMSFNQNKGFQAAILFGIALSPAYIKKLIQSAEYVPDMIRDSRVGKDEFHLTEIKTDKMADELADLITAKGYAAYSQSEGNIAKSGSYYKKTKSTPLPHKTIALMAGIGWIGKHNLLVTPEYGSAFSMCTVLTDAPLKTMKHIPAGSKCGNCKICVDICRKNAIKGKPWGVDVPRDEIVDVFKCTPCLQCMVNCPWTLAYVNKK